MSNDNRWGDLIFETSDLSNHWDGMHNGEPLESGVYIYKIRVKGENNETKEVIGHVNLLR